MFLKFGNRCLLNYTLNIRYIQIHQINVILMLKVPLQLVLELGAPGTMWFGASQPLREACRTGDYSVSPK